MTDRTIVFIDGRCGLCRRTSQLLHSLDWLHRLQFENYHDPQVRSHLIPGVAVEELDRLMHAKFSDGKTCKGFFAIRALCWQLPLLWILAPLLYLPGIPWIGQKAYAAVSQRRHQI